MKPLSLLRLALLILLALPTLGQAQGLLIDVRPNTRIRLPRPVPQPQPENSYKIKEIAINVDLQGQIAKTQVSQSFVNTGSRQMEVCFVFPLPYDGAVDSLTFMVDGKEYQAELLSADKAREIYEGYVRRNQDPALLEWIGTGMFKTSVFPVPPGAERKVTLRYTQLCRKSHGLTEFLFPMSTAKYTSTAVENVKVRVNVRSEAKIKNVYSPTHSIEIKRPSKKNAIVSYESKNQVPSEDFRLLYDVGDAEVAASVLSYRPLEDEDGYFLMLVNPEIKREADKVPSKTVVFVVDRSGSMNGKKIEQAKGALKYVLNNLNEGDTFNIIAYDSAVESFKPELQRYDEETREEALGFVEGIYAGGSTNISGALTTALSQLNDEERPSYVIFLTDGLPTAGETNEMKIVDMAEKANDVRARIFSFGVGYDVNSRLLDKLSRELFGQSEYVRPNEDIEEYVSRLYNRIGAPAMTEVAINMEIDDRATSAGSLTNRIYPADAYDLFAGDQLVVVGRYKDGGDAKVVIKGNVDGKKKKFDFPAKLVNSSGDESYAFIEKVWALRRVGEIIDQIDLNGKNDELVQELVTLATKHGILTPYTSFLADDDVDPRGVASNRRRADLALERLEQASGQGGFTQRLFKGSLQRAATPGAVAESAPAPADAAQLATPATNSAPGGFGVAGGGAPLADADGQVEGKNKARDRNLRKIGAKTFYRRGEEWVDSTLTEEQEKKVIEIERYSKEYFDLAAKYGKSAAKYFAQEGKVTVVLDGQAYSF